jgi:hypothetical protein
VKRLNQTEEILKKIESGVVKVKGRKKKTIETATTAASEAPAKTKETQPKTKPKKIGAEQVVAAMKAAKDEHGKDFAITSTVLRDAFKLKNRAAARP